MLVAPLDENRLAAAAAELAARDPDLRRVVERYGNPPLWARAPGFATLIQIILEQQVSLASAAAAFGRLKLTLGEVTPAAFLRLDEVELKRIGFSRQKAQYGRLLAQAVDRGDLDVAGLAVLEDDVVRDQLMRQKGLGRWSADIYLLMALGRPDIWPRSDLALVSAVARLKHLPARPTPAEFEEIGAAWQPWRSVAARLAWFEYLGGKA